MKILQIHPKVDIKINTGRTLSVISSLYKYIHKRGSSKGHSSIKNGFWKVSSTSSSCGKQQRIQSDRDGTGRAERSHRDQPQQEQGGKRRARRFLLDEDEGGIN